MRKKAKTKVRKTSPRRLRRGFTLVELIVVMGILAVLLAITLVAINPAEQLNKTKDIATLAVASDYIKASTIYSIETKSLPWENNTACNTEMQSGGYLADMPACATELVKDGNIQASEMQSTEFKQIYVAKCGNSAVLCYNPKSKVEYESVDTKYDKFGVVQPGCPGKQGDGSQCYWCKPVRQDAACLVNPTPTITPTPTPSNPWGKAAVFAGVVAGRNPPSYTPIPQYMEAAYDTRMNLSSPNLTVEAWIKPTVPTAAGYDYRIVDNTYRLTMTAKPSGANVLYQYYFDVQAANNSCNQTVVYSGHANVNPWDNSNYTLNTPVQFTTWKHVAGVVQNGNMAIYENGIKLNTYNVGLTVCNDGRSMHVGAGLFGKNTPFYDYFQGAIDEVRVSNIARYTSNFAPQKTPFSPDSSTVMLYHFDGNTNDSSSNALNGTLTGSVSYTTSDIPTN